jgi:hypothetical protein
LENKAALNAMEALCNNVPVDREAVLASHYQATTQGMANAAVVLVLQDTTEC